MSIVDAVEREGYDYLGLEILDSRRFIAYLNSMYSANRQGLLVIDGVSWFKIESQKGPYQNLAIRRDRARIQIGTLKDELIPLASLFAHRDNKMTGRYFTLDGKLDLFEFRINGELSLDFHLHKHSKLYYVSEL